MASATSAVRFMTFGRLYSDDTLLERLPQDLQDMAAALGPCIQAAHAVVGQRHLARQRHVAPADQPYIGDDVMRGAARAGRDQGRPGAREASDAIDTGGLKGVGEGRRRQDGGVVTSEWGSTPSDSLTLCN
jgi:hypothetical protein